MRILHWLRKRHESVIQYLQGFYAKNTIFVTLSWEQQADFRSVADPADEFESLRQSVSLREWCDSRDLMPRLLIYGFPLAIYALGYVLSYFTGTAAQFLNDPVPVVFAGVSFMFLHTVFLFDRQLFDVIERIKPAFDVDEESYYSFFGELVERVYEPWRLSHRSGVGYVHIPTVGAFAIGVSYVVGLAVTNAGNAPSTQPLALQAYFWATTVIGVFGLVVIGWTVFVIFVFMTILAKELPIRLVLTRNHNNLGLQAYGEFVVSITVRIFIALAIVGIATVTRPSPFIYTIFVFVSLVVLLWFFGTQYGLHRSIVAAKQRSIRKIEEEYPVEFPNEILASGDAVGEKETTLSQARTGIRLKREIDNLPDWPVTSGNIFKLGSSVVGSTLSVFGSALYELFIQFV